MFTRDVMCTGKEVETQVVAQTAIHEYIRIQNCVQRTEWIDVDAFIIAALDASFRTKDDTAHTTTVLYKSTPAQAYEHKHAVARQARVSFRTHVSTTPPDE